MQEKKTGSRTIVMLGLLTAIEIVLSRFCSISAWNIKIGLAFVPLVLAAMLYGPLAGGAVGAVVDLIGALLFPIGAYFPGFTLTAFLNGMFFGLLLHKKRTMPRVICAVAVTQLCCSLLLNTLWISLLYGSPFEKLLIARGVQCTVLVPTQIIVIGILTRSTSLFARQAIA